MAYDKKVETVIDKTKDRCESLEIPWDGLCRLAGYLSLHRVRVDSGKSVVVASHILVECFSDNPVDDTIFYRLYAKIRNLMEVEGWLESVSKNGRHIVRGALRDLVLSGTDDIERHAGVWRADVLRQYSKVRNDGAISIDYDVMQEADIAPAPGRFLVDEETIDRRISQIRTEDLPAARMEALVILAKIVCEGASRSRDSLDWWKSQATMIDLIEPSLEAV